MSGVRDNGRIAQPQAGPNRGYNLIAFRAAKEIRRLQVIVVFLPPPRHTSWCLPCRIFSGRCRGARFRRGGSSAPIRVAAYAGAPAVSGMTPSCCINAAAFQ